MLPHAPSASWQTLVLPCAALHGMLCLLFLGICEYKLLPSGQSLLCLCVLTIPDENKSQVCLKTESLTQLCPQSAKGVGLVNMPFWTHLQFPSLPGTLLLQDWLDAAGHHHQVGSITRWAAYGPSTSVTLRLDLLRCLFCVLGQPLPQPKKRKRKTYILYLLNKHFWGFQGLDKWHSERREGRDLWGSLRILSLTYSTQASQVHFPET